VDDTAEVVYIGIRNAMNYKPCWSANTDHRLVRTASVVDLASSKPRRGVAALWSVACRAGRPPTPMPLDPTNRSARCSVVRDCQYRCLTVLVMRPRASLVPQRSRSFPSQLVRDSEVQQPYPVGHADGQIDISTHVPAAGFHHDGP